MNNLVPDGWIISKIGDSCEILDSKRIPLNSQERAKRIGFYPYYGANGVQGFIDDFIFEGEHVLLAEDGGNFDQWESRAISYLVDGKFWVNNHAHILKAKNENLTRFMHYSLVHKNIMKHINGGTRAKLNQSDMRDIQFLCPPLPEQQKIAAILTSVDDVIEKTQAQIDKLKDLKTGMMQSLLTNGVGIDGKPHTEFKDSPVGRVPKGWKVLPLADVVERIIDCEHKTAPYVEKSEYMVVRTSNVRNGQLVLEDMKFTHADGYAEWTKRAVPSSGDVMFTREAPAGESCLVPDNLNVCLGQRMVLLRPNTEVILPCFFSLFLTSASAVKSIYELSIGTTVSRINIEDIKKIPCVLPSLAEQLKISNSIQSVQILLNAKRSKLKSVNKTKKALMQDLLTGKVRVNVSSETSGH